MPYRRLFVLVMLVLGLGARLDAAPAYVQTVTGDCSGTATPGTCATGAATFTAGNSVILFVDVYNNNGSNPTFTAADSASNTWDCSTITPTPTNFTINVGACIATNLSGSLTNDVVTVTFTGLNYYPSMIGMEYSGLATSNVIDTQANASTSGTSVTSATFTTAQASEVVACGMGTNASGQSWTAGNIGGTAATSRGTIYTHAAEDLIVSSIQTNITGDASFSASASLQITCVTLKATTSSGGRPSFPCLLGVGCNE